MKAIREKLECERVAHIATKLKLELALEVIGTIEDAVFSRNSDIPRTVLVKLLDPNNTWNH